MSFRAVAASERKTAPKCRGSSRTRAFRKEYLETRRQFRSSAISYRSGRYEDLAFAEPGIAGHFGRGERLLPLGSHNSILLHQRYGNIWIDKQELQPGYRVAVAMPGSRPSKRLVNGGYRLNPWERQVQFTLLNRKHEPVAVYSLMVKPEGMIYATDARQFIVEGGTAQRLVRQEILERLSRLDINRFVPRKDVCCVVESDENRSADGGDFDRTGKAHYLSRGKLSVSIQPHVFRKSFEQIEIVYRHECAHAYFERLQRDPVRKKVLMGQFRDFAQGRPLPPNMKWICPEMDARRKAQPNRLFHLFCESRYPSLHDADTGHPYDNENELFASASTVLRMRGDEFVGRVIGAYQSGFLDAEEVLKARRYAKLVVQQYIVKGSAAGFSNRLLRFLNIE